MKNGNGALDAVALKDALWDVLQKVKAKKMTPASGGAVACQAREILRTVKTQLAIFSAAGKGVTDELVTFASPNGRPKPRASQRPAKR